MVDRIGPRVQVKDRKNSLFLLMEKKSSVTGECLLQVTFFYYRVSANGIFRLYAHKTGRIALYTMKNTQERGRALHLEGQ
jgi:hypothetical protein